jgi:class 3 adenylate cyclase
MMKSDEPDDLVTLMSAFFDKYLQQRMIKLAQAGSLPSDTEDQHLRKAMLVFLVTIYCVLGLLWGCAYFILGFPLCAGIPFGYSMISIVTLVVFFQTKRYGFFRFTQLMLILLMPFLLQMSLGGFAVSSAVMIWAILSPIGALMFAGTRQALPWFFGYLLLMVVSGIFDGMFAHRALMVKLPPMINRLFFVMNIGGVTSISFVLLRYFVRRRELAMEALDRKHNRVSRERERLDKIKSIMAHFIPETAKRVIEQDPEGALLDKYIQDATVLFLDIEGFSTLVQKYPHEQINRAIELYFSLFLDMIQKNGGDINETAGDGMMVIFLHPNADRHAENAIRTAMEIKTKCRDVANGSNSDLFPVSVNVGISSGDVYLGSTKLRGTEGDRWTFTASGPVTILAARLSEYGRGGMILISQETARRVGKSFSLHSVGTPVLKNLKDSGEVFEVR